jgi:hypothetical protein
LVRFDGSVLFSRFSVRFEGSALDCLWLVVKGSHVLDGFKNSGLVAW